MQRGVIAHPPRVPLGRRATNCDANRDLEQRVPRHEGVSAVEPRQRSADATMRLPTLVELGARWSRAASGQRARPSATSEARPAPPARRIPRQAPGGSSHPSRRRKHDRAPRPMPLAPTAKPPQLATSHRQKSQNCARRRSTTHPLPANALATQQPCLRKVPRTSAPSRPRRRPCAPRPTSRQQSGPHKKCCAQ